MTITLAKTFEVVECANCHVDFALSKWFVAEKRGDHTTFYCPQGHSQFFPGKSDEEKLREQLAREKRMRGYTEATLTATRDQLQATEYSRRGEKAAKTRLKNRIAAGVCPCCNRQFQNLHRHMTGQHPDFTTTEGNAS